MASNARCTQCGAGWPTRTDGPCEKCGCTSKTVDSGPIVISAGTTITVEHSVTSSNGAEAKARQLAAAVAAVDASIDTHIVGDAQDATKRALEAIHELSDCLTKRNEWAQAGWSEDELGIWHGLIGARNAAHHFASPVVTQHGQGPRESRLRWNVDLTVVAELNSPTQQREYVARLASEPVLPQLRAVLSLIEAAVLRGS